MYLRINFFAVFWQMGKEKWHSVIWIRWSLDLFQYLKNTFYLIPLKTSKGAGGKSKDPCTKIPWKLNFICSNNLPGVYWFENLALSIKHQGMFGKATEIHLPRGCIVGTFIDNTYKLALCHHCKHSYLNDYKILWMLTKWLWKHWFSIWH